MKKSSITQGTIPTDIPERTFVQDMRSDQPTFWIFQTNQFRNTSIEIEEVEGFESSFISLHHIYRVSPKAVIGYAITVKRGAVTNLGVSLVVQKSRLGKDTNGVVNLSLSQEMIKLGDLLRVFKLGDAAIFIGAPNDYPPFFY